MRILSDINTQNPSWKKDFKGTYNTTALIQNNTVLNKAILSLIGFQIPFCLTANNKYEQRERLLQGVWYMGTTYASPFFLLPFLNKRILYKQGITKGLSDKGVEIIRLSKDFLNKDSEKMVQGIKECAKFLEEKNGMKGMVKEFDQILDRFPDKEVLRKKLIKANQEIFKYDFIFTGITTGTAMPWVSNFFTEITTGRKGYSGEFKIADEKYTDKLSEKHEKYKYSKIALSVLFGIIPALVIPKMASKAMLKTGENLKGLPKFLNKNAKLFDYTDGKFMSLLTYAVIWSFSDFPAYLLATRDRHELKYLAISRSVVGLSFFGGELALSNWIGRIVDKKFKTNLLDKEKLKNAPVLQKIFTPARSLSKLENLNADKKTKTAAVAMYWGSMLLNAGIVGYGLPKLLNVALKKNVEKDLSKEKAAKA